MTFYTVKTPRWLPPLQPAGLLWRLGNSAPAKTVYLTFDDGPHPDVTPQVLELLQRYDAKATFFCVGQNVERYPEIYAQIHAGGHRVGNHTQHHKNGWKSDTEAYLKDVAEARQFIDSPLFRPPYGRIRKAQASKLQQEDYQIVMWEVLAGDFDAAQTAKQCAARILRHSGRGSIIVLHDSLKSAPRCLPALELVLRAFRRRGIVSAVLPY
jgi:peptidoglycan/xylan/chitin deacetylase (PgdA/CDA1 family)